MYSRILVLVVSLAILAPFEVIAGTATQTDWSGGDGIWGPVFDWADEFYLDTDIECYSDPLDIVLSQPPLEHTVEGNFNEANSVYSADINGDGYMDVLGTAFFDDDITWWENLDGSGTIWIEHTINAEFHEPSEVCSADIDGDGDLDVLGGCFISITWWENLHGLGENWIEHNIEWGCDCVSSVYSADINGDGDMDVIGCSIWWEDTIIWWENIDGSGLNWTEHTVNGEFNEPESVFSADINGDGYMDVLGAGLTSIIWWENVDGTGTSWTEHTVDDDFIGAASVYSADINGDGYLDVLGACYNDDDITWWQNVDGSGISWIEHVVDGDFDNAYDVYSADINEDGDMDVLGAAKQGDDITWWENVDGSGTSWIEHVVDGDFDGANSVYAEDVNGDGNLDILGAAFNANDISWWDLHVFSPDGSLESSVLDVQESPDWQIIDWSCTEPSGTSVALQVRASDNSSSMGAWSDTLTAPCTLEGILADEDSYFQYRAILTTTDSYSTPELHDVTVVWLPYVGTHEGAAGEVTQFALFGAQPNPALGYAALVFSQPVHSRVELTVYDLTGRVIHTLSGDFEAGVHEVILDALACGMYMVRMTSGEFTAIQHFVVID